MKRIHHRLCYADAVASIEGQHRAVSRAQRYAKRELRAAIREALEEYEECPYFNEDGEEILYGDANDVIRNLRRERNHARRWCNMLKDRVFELASAKFE